MGKQVNFYMTEDDEAEFLSFLRSDSKICVFRDHVRQDEIEPISTLPDRSVPFWFSAWLWDTRCPRPILDYIERQKHYAIDYRRSEVIEFSRSYKEGGLLVPGRIWAEFKYYAEDGTVIEKSEAFKKFFNRVASWIRRKGTKKGIGYLLPGAANYVQNGGKIR